MERTETSFEVRTEGGVRKTVTILSAVSVDDLVRVGLKAYVHAVRTKGEYVSPFTRGIRDQIVSVRVAQRSS